MKKYLFLFIAMLMSVSAFTLVGCSSDDDDEQGGLRFEIDKSRISIRLTAPYTDDRRKAASELAKKRGIHTKP